MAAANIQQAHIDEITEPVKRFILDTFLPGEDPSALEYDTPLISGGIIDSISTLKLVTFLEEEFDALKKILASKYLCNFSLFRSAPDSWAIGQLFPIMPIHRLNEHPTDYATMVDVTCDSDGRIDRFVDLRDVKETLEVHPFTGDSYYFAIFLVGAYQEVMGSYHNLFGLPTEAQVVIDPQPSTVAVVRRPRLDIDRVVALRGAVQVGVEAGQREALRDP